MLRRDICKLCVARYGSGNTPWSVEDDRRWDQGLLSCDMDASSDSVKGRVVYMTIYGEPPAGCYYMLEQTVLNQ